MLPVMSTRLSFASMTSPDVEDCKLHGPRVTILFGEVLSSFYGPKRFRVAEKGKIFSLQ